MTVKTLIIKGTKMERTDAFIFTNSRDLENRSYTVECDKDQADGIFIPDQGKDKHGKCLVPGWCPKNNIDNWNEL